MALMGRLLRILWRWSLLLLLLVALFAAGEDAVLRYRLQRGAGSAVLDHVTTYDAAEMKNGRVEIYFDHPEIRECVHSVFPHFGDPPCWYVRRHVFNLLSNAWSGAEWRAAQCVPARAPSGSSRLRGSALQPA